MHCYCDASALLTFQVPGGSAAVGGRPSPGLPLRAAADLPTGKSVRDQGCIQGCPRPHVMNLQLRAAADLPTGMSVRDQGCIQGCPRPHVMNLQLRAAADLPTGMSARGVVTYRQEGKEILSKDEDALQTLKGPKDSDDEEEEQQREGGGGGECKGAEGKERLKESSPTKAPKGWSGSADRFAHPVQK
eukprot:1139488-Pelagomonas_calceolata.AAC.4